MLCFAGFFSLQYGHISADTLTSFLQLKQAAICYPIEIKKYLSAEESCYTTPTDLNSSTKSHTKHLYDSAKAK